MIVEVPGAPSIPACVALVPTGLVVAIAGKFWPLIHQSKNSASAHDLLLAFGSALLSASFTSAASVLLAAGALSPGNSF